VFGAWLLYFRRLINWGWWLVFCGWVAHRRRLVNRSWWNVFCGWLGHRRRIVSRSWWLVNRSRWLLLVIGIGGSGESHHGKKQQN
jgi:hypothetical protein